jgi:hypothetical protein
VWRADGDHGPLRLFDELGSTAALVDGSGTIVASCRFGRG